MASFQRRRGASRAHRERLPRRTAGYLSWGITHATWRLAATLGSASPDRTRFKSRRVRHMNRVMPECQLLHASCRADRQSRINSNNGQDTDMVKALYLLFVLSGAAGLIYESTWTRYL